MNYFTLPLLLIYQKYFGFNIFLTLLTFPSAFSSNLSPRLGVRAGPAIARRQEAASGREQGQNWDSDHTSLL